MQAAREWRRSVTETSVADKSAEQTLIQMLTGAWVTQLLSAITRLNIPDELAIRQPQSIEQLSRRVGANADALHRAMRALSSLGVFKEVPPDRYALTELGTLLCSGQDGSMRDFLLAETDIVHRGAWGALVDAIRTGKPQPASVFGMSVFEYYSAHVEDGQQFGRAMENVSVMSAQGILDHYDFKNAGLIVDVGGGNGSLVRAITRQYPRAQGIVCDLPYVETQATAAIKTDGLEDRCHFQAGDFFERVPPGGDIYLLRFILHDWADAESRRILRSIRAAIKPGGRLLIVEMLLPENNEPGFVQLMDINMLAMTGGRERSAAEYCKLCAGEGFRLMRTVPTGSQFWIAECEPQ